MICALSYPFGKPLEKDFSLDHLIDHSLEEVMKRICVFSPGTYNLTPAIPKGNCYYTLEVREDGGGTLEMVARTRDVVTYFIEEEKASGPQPGDRTFRLPDDETLVLIAAQTTVEETLLYHILFHLPSPLVR